MASAARVVRGFAESPRACISATGTEPLLCACRTKLIYVYQAASASSSPTKLELLLLAAPLIEAQRSVTFAWNIDTVSWTPINCRGSALPGRGGQPAGIDRDQFIPSVVVVHHRTVPNHP